MMNMKNSNVIEDSRKLHILKPCNKCNFLYCEVRFEIFMVTRIKMAFFWGGGVESCSLARIN